MLWFWAAYVAATVVGVLHCVFNIYVLHMKPMDEHGMGEAYEKTKPWHIFLFLFSEKFLSKFC